MSCAHFGAVDLGVGGALRVSDLKTASSRHTVALDEATVAELRHHRRQQLEQQMATGVRSGEDYVFAQPDGSPPNPHRITDTFIRAVKQLDVPRIRFHDLRHTHTTILLQHNVHPKVVSERLGHSNVALTMNIYQHVMPAMQAAAADAFGAAVFG
ncbi:MAG: site-specific integrase [bacterium]|nr:site-specific integrase [bacterium]MCY4103561.1 site-specific integrase [bacterium]